MVLFLRRIAFFYKRSSLISNWKLFLLFNLLPPVLQTICYSLVAYYVYGVDYIQSWMIGNSILIASFGALYGVGSQLLIEKRNGTLSLLIASSTSLQEIFIASTFSSIITSGISVITGVTIVSLIFKIAWDIKLISSFFIILIIAVFTSMSFGYVFSLFILLSSEVNLLLNTTSQILLIFTGANFPISNLPDSLQLFSLCLPLTRTIRAAQGIMNGDNLIHYKNLLLQETLLGLIYILIGSISLHFIERKARETGKIDFI